MTRAIRQALTGLSVQLAAVGAPPALATHTGTVHTEAVARAVGVGAVG